MCCKEPTICNNVHWVNKKGNLRTFVWGNRQDHTLSIRTNFPHIFV